MIRVKTVSLAGSHGPLSGRGLRFTFSSAPRSPINRCSGAGGERGLGNGSSSGSSSVSGSGATKICVNFDQTQEAYKSKDSLELLRSLVVFKLCSYDFLVDRNREIMTLGKKILGQTGFNQLMKMTFYGQFVAGEDHVAIRPLIRKNQAFGVGSVLDYSVEEDINTEADDASAAQEENKNLGQTTHTAHGGGGAAARGRVDKEAKCDQHMETFIKCIKASGETVKLPRFSCITVCGVLSTAIKALLIMSSIFCGYRTIDMLDWNSLFDDRAKNYDLLVVPNVELGEMEQMLKNFTEKEEIQMKRILQRLDVLAKHAVQSGVRLMVDAEQTYFQPAISRLTLEMQRIYNREKPVIFNTYQCYLKEAFDTVSMDVELSRREGWHFAAKLVRGAYMHQERERAKELGYEDPINPDYESTNRMYHRCLDHILEEIATNRKANVMVASHNEETIKHTINRMNELGLLPSESKVSFGQLLGMCDQISFPLGQAGLPVYKYVPYGPINDVLPYLSRRAQENQGFMKGAQKERELLWEELKRRLLSGELFHRPVC
uniref:Proline dehydrogenase n=1 Tax=Takifugu rubripes TaxID=31033 RepID=H2UYX0_TAKRU